MVRSGARLLHTILPEKFKMWKLELQCHGRTFGIDLRSTRQQLGSGGSGGSGGGGGGGGDVWEHACLPHSFLPENLESTDSETLFLECFIRCFFRKVNLIHLYGIILPIKPFFSLILA